MMKRTLFAGIGASLAPDPIYSECIYAHNSFCFASSEGDSHFVYESPNADHDVAAHITFDKLHPLDETGNGVNLHPSGFTGPNMLGGSGGSLLIDGKTQFSTKPGGVALDQNHGWTISFWFFVDDSPATAAHVPVIVAWVDELHIGLVHSTRHSFRLFVAASPAPVSCPAIKENYEDRWGDLVFEGELPTRRWTHLAITSSTSQGTRVFINGVMTNHAVDSTNINSAFNFGPPEASSCASFVGYVDELLVQRKARTRAEVGSLLAPKFADNLASKATLVSRSIIQTQIVNACTGQGKVLCHPSDILNLYPNLYSLGLLTRPLGLESTRVWHSGSVESSEHDTLGVLMCCDPQQQDAAAASTTSRPCLE